MSMVSSQPRLREMMMIGLEPVALTLWQAALLLIVAAALLIGARME